MTELVALVDPSGVVVGSAPREEVRRDILRHAATAVLVRDPGGRIHLHRRSEDKDWAPGHWDAAAGGVLRAGEEPAACAARELAEELGVSDVSLRPLGTHLYEDATTRVFEHAFEVCWDGPVLDRSEEVVEGHWADLEELARSLADPSFRFVPDTRQLLGVLARRNEGDYARLRAVTPNRPAPGPDTS